MPQPTLIDISRMAWAMREAFYAVNATPLKHVERAVTAAEFWPALRFTMTLSFHLIQLDWAIEALWHALKKTRTPQPMFRQSIVAA